MLGQERIRSLLREALRHCPSDADGDIYLTATEQALTRFANNRIHQNVAHQDAIAHVRVAIGKRQGRAVTNNLSETGLADAVRQAAEYARLMPEDPDFPGLPEPDPAQSVSAYDESTAACDADPRAAVPRHPQRQVRGQRHLVPGAAHRKQHDQPERKDRRSVAGRR